MSETTLQTDGHKENQDNGSSDNLTNQKTETNKDLLENLDHKEELGKDNEIFEEDPPDYRKNLGKEDEEISEEDFLNYYGYENENELKYQINIRGDDFFDYMMISNNDFQSFCDKEDFSPYENDLQFYIIQDTRKNHKFKELKEHRSEIVERRNNILMLSKILGRFSLDILNDWNKIEELGLTDDKLSSRDSMNLREINELCSILNINQLEIAMKLTRKDILNILNIKKSSNLSDIYFDDILELKDYTPEDVQIAKKKADYLGIENISASEVTTLKDISKDALQYCSENSIKDISQINLIKEIYTLKNKESLKEYIGRKNEYLSKNRTISEEKFIEYFGKKGKHGKQDIQQGRFGLCYMYSAIEALKKMNGFDELIQTNLIENDKGWLVRLPFQNGTWIQVSKDEIDKKYTIEKDGLFNDDNSPEAELLKLIFGTTYYRTIKINSNTESLGIKILEIAYIKNTLIKGKLSENKQKANHNIEIVAPELKTGTGTIEDPIDLEYIDGDMLESIEGGKMIQPLKDILGEQNVHSKIYSAIWDILKEEHIKQLKLAKVPEYIINRHKKYLGFNGKFKDIAFGSFKSGFISINIAIDDAAIDKLGKWENIKHKKVISTCDVKILDKTGKEIPTEILEKESDVSIDETSNITAKFFSNHAYSIEKCYTNEEGEKRMRVVNPWHTEIKFDIPFERCRDNFIRKIGVIKIDNLFR